MASLNECMLTTEKIKNESLRKKNVLGIEIRYKKIKGKSTKELSIVILVESKVKKEHLSSEDFYLLRFKE